MCSLDFHPEHAVDDHQAETHLLDPAGFGPSVASKDHQVFGAMVWNMCAQPLSIRSRAFRRSVTPVSRISLLGSYLSQRPHRHRCRRDATTPRYSHLRTEPYVALMRVAPFAVDVLDRLEPIAREWDELAGSIGAPPFVHSGWIRSWWSAFGHGDPHVFVVRRDDRLVGLLPMQKRHGALRSPTNAHTPAFDLLTVDEETDRVLARALFASGFREITLSFIDAGGNRLDVLRAAAAAAGYRTIGQPILRAPRIRGGMSLAAYRRSVSHNLRHDVERRLRRLCEAGAVSVQVSDGRERLDELLDEGLRVEASGWKGGTGTAIGSQVSTRHFYREMARWAASLGWLRLAFLRFDKRAIAFQFDLESGRTYYSLKIGYDPEYERFSPGKLLTYTMVSRAVASGLDTYELLGTDEPWKYRWTDSFHERVMLRCFAPSPTGFLAWSGHTYGRRFARHLPLARRVAAALRD
jgi:CelD/BcsL family acetyltransferase involved in cellulose biosynthesis